MNAGLQILAADGSTVVIDQNFRNLAVVEKATVATTTVLGSSSTITFTRTGRTMPVIAMTGSTPAVATALNNGSGSFTFYIVASGGVGTNVSYFIFDVPPSTDPHFGLRIFDASGNVTYNSGLQYLRVRDVPSQTNSATLTYDSGHAYAVASNALGYVISNIAGNIQQAVSKTVSNVVTIQQTIVGSWPGTPTFLNQQLGRWMVIDVTNY